MRNRANGWWSAAELRSEANVDPRVLVALAKQRIIPSPGRGPSAGYDLHGRIRVLAAVNLQRRGYSGQALVTAMSSASNAELRKHAGLPPEPEAAPPAPVTSLTPSGHSTWLRVTVAPGVELHVDVTQADLASKLGTLLKSLTAATKG